MRVLFEQIPEATIHRTVEAIFRSTAYNRTSLWDRLWGWAREMLGRFFAWISPAFHVLRHSPPLYWAVIITLGILAAAVVARWLFLWRAHTARVAAGEGWEQLVSGARGDAWAAAQQLAARGNYTAAAHALYAALLDAGAQRHQLRLHPSKTAGDYVREVRRRSPPTFAGFRDFARAYDFVIYGLGECTLERYELLHALALPIVRPNG